MFSSRLAFTASRIDSMAAVAATNIPVNKAADSSG